MILENPVLWLVFLAYFTWKFFAKSTRNGLPLPPGPPGLPLIGNLLDVPKEFMWLTFEKYRQEYGPVVSLQLLGKTLIIINTVEAASNILEKRSSNYSDRIRVPMLGELMGWSWNFSFLPYGPKWRNHRRVFHQYFNQHAIEPYKPIQLRESRAFLRRLLDKPEEFGDHICLAFTATIMDVTYGIKVADKEDKYVTIAEAAIESASRAGVPGAYLVDFFPILKHVPTWFPGAGFKRKAEAWRRLSDEFINGPFEAVKTTLREHGSDTQPSIASALLRNLPERDSEEAEELARNVTALAYAGGADTSANVIRVFFLAMVSYPEAQKKAQAELDSVIGNSRLPDFSDQKDLPYVNALIKETLRWQPVTPLAIPHSATADDVYEGYFIPKGSIILGNSWSMLRDPIAYPEPEEFKPERFLKDGELNPAVRDPDTAAFGYGRRICPGRHFSSSLLYALISSTLAVYEIGPPLDERGEPVLVTPEMTSGLLSAPTLFKCTIKPRSQAAEDLIRETQMEEGVAG